MSEHDPKHGAPVASAESEASDPTNARTGPSRLFLWVAGGIALLIFLIGGAGGQYEGKLSQVQKNDNSAFLPSSAESTKVSNETEKFNPSPTIPGFAIYQRDGKLTDADRGKIKADVAKIRSISGVDAQQVGVPQISKDGTTASVSVPLVTKDNGKDIDGETLSATEKKVVEVIKKGNPPGLAAHSAGAGGLLVAFIDSFQGIDGKLIGIAGLVVIVLLLFVYRSPVLWFFPLFSAALSLGVSSIIVYFLAKNEVITLDGQSQGILSVLVIGAGTDYALLLISRYREELHNYQSRAHAMWVAWRGAAPAIVASAVTVILALLCLLVSDLRSNRGLGPVCAIGVACTAIVMLTFLPAILVLVGRWIFWPRKPKVDHATDLANHGMWGRIAGAVGRRARFAWISTAVVLLACTILVTTLRSGGLSTIDSFTNNPDAVTGQKIYDAKFDRGAGTPAVITAPSGGSLGVIAKVKQVPGVAQSDGAVCIQPDYAKLAAAIKANPSAATGSGCVPKQLQVQPIDGRTVINAQLVDSYDSPAAQRTIERLRDAVGSFGADTVLVGGQTATNLDTLDASRRDRNVIIPIALVVILIVLALLLRALVVPLLLIATVVLSFLATLGVSAFFFNHVFGFANADPGFPLYAFIFLVALGIDYNIFLMTRVREETLEHGTRSGVLRGLAVTGGVITSAGVVLASTFAVLGVLPLVFLAEVGFAVAFGVLLDTILVRSVLVPALSHDLGRRIWWPSALARAKP